MLAKNMSVIKDKKMARQACWIAGLLWVAFHGISASQTQEELERGGRPGNSKDILASTREFARAVNGNALVRNRCRLQGKETEVEETSEVIESEVTERDRCKLVVRVRKVTRAADGQAADRPGVPEKQSSTGRQAGEDQKRSAEGQREIEFFVYADLSELTTPVLLEKQKFAQCETGGAGVLKVSSRSAPGTAMQMLRRSPASGNMKDDAGVKQTRRDLSLFFSVPGAAEKARKSLERAVKSCGGKEWPDEDDLP